MATDRCIYCDEIDPKKFSGREHVIPKCFGTFGGQTPVLKCVCDGCNSAFGQELDQMLARETLEGLLRYKQGKFSGEKRVQRRLRVTLADEPEAGELVGSAILGVDPTTGQLLPLATQLRIKNQQTGEIDTFTRAELGSFTLPEDIYGAPGDRKLVVYAASKHENESFIEELNLAGFDMRMEGSVPIGMTPSVDENGNETLGFVDKGYPEFD